MPNGKEEEVRRMRNTYDQLLLHFPERELGVVLHHRLFFCVFWWVVCPETETERSKKNFYKHRSNKSSLTKRRKQTAYFLKVKPLFLSASSASRSSTKQTYSPEPDFSLEGGKSTLTPWKTEEELKKRQTLFLFNGSSRLRTIGQIYQSTNKRTPDIPKLISSF